MQSPRHNSGLVAVAALEWIGGGAVILACVLIFLRETDISTTVQSLVTLSTIAMVQGFASIRSRPHQKMECDGQNAHWVTHLLAALCAIVHCVALVMPVPLSYLMWTVEGVLFFMTIRRLWEASL